MPHYEFVCNACKKTFLKTLTIAEHEAEKAACLTAAVTRLSNAGPPSLPSPRRRAPERNGTEVRMHLTDFPSAHYESTAARTSRTW
jgi:hypothetical protein